MSISFRPAQLPAVLVTLLAASTHGWQVSFHDNAACAENAQSGSAIDYYMPHGHPGSCIAIGYPGEGCTYTDKLIAQPACESKAFLTEGAIISNGTTCQFFKTSAGACADPLDPTDNGNGEQLDLVVGGGNCEPTTNWPRDVSMICWDNN